MAYDFGDEAKLTDEQLAGELAKVTPLTQEELKGLLPDREDRKKLKEIIDIVNSAAADNDKKAQIKANLEKFGNVAVAILLKYLKPL